MTADLSKEALDALVESLRQIGGHGFPNWSDDAADAITALRAENKQLERNLAVAEKMAADANDSYSQQHDALIEASARATAAEAALAASMEGAVRVKKLSWSEIGAMWQAWDEAFETPRYSETVEECARTDRARSARILAALEPNPAAQDREALIAATLERVIDTIRRASGLTKDPAGDGATYTYSMPSLRTLEDAIRALATQPQTDALAARDRAKVAEGMRKAAAWHAVEIKRLEDQIEENNAYCARSGGNVSGANRFCRELITNHVLARDAILAEAQKEADRAPMVQQEAAQLSWPAAEVEDTILPAIDETTGALIRKEGEA